MAKKLTSTKARKILHDKEVHGQPLTDKQRRFFGAIAGGAKPYKAESGGWLDKYDAPQAQNGIEGTMGGLTDIGFNYNGAWGGTMQMGGSLPGAVGFTYARTQSPAPSNGPYAKKTKASAQNGQEMKYYQEGLDFKPKTISQDGSRTPIYVSDPNDPRLKTYQDSLYSYNVGQRMAGILQNDKNLIKVSPKSIIYKNLQAALKASPSGLLDNSSYDSGGYRNYEKLGSIMKEYQSKGNKGILPIRYQPYWPNPDNTVMDLVTLRGFRDAIGLTKEPRPGSANLPEWKKPEQQVILDPSKAPKKQTSKTIGPFPIIETPRRGKYVPIEKEEIDLGYNLPTPKPFIAPKTPEQTPTKYTFTYPTGEYNQQKTMYFPSKSALKSFTEGVRGATYQEGADYATATGNLQDGGGIPVDPMGYWNPENVGRPVIIPSNIITMEGVDQPLLGISDTGDVQYMEPGEDYEFDGEYVTEYPVAQKGKTIPAPTTADSARLYNAQMALNKFYENEMKAGRLKKQGQYNLFDMNPFSNNLKGENLNFYREQIRRRQLRGGLYDDKYKKYFNLSPEQVKQLEYRGLAQTKGASEYQQYYRDIVTPQQNLGAPFALIDSRITPQRVISYEPTGKNEDYPGGFVEVYDYDPLAIKPYNMRTPQEKIEWEKKYGKKETSKAKPTPPPAKKKVVTSTPEAVRQTIPPAVIPSSTSSTKSVSEKVGMLDMFGKKDVELLVDNFGNYEWFRKDDDIGDLKPIRRATREEIEYSKKQKQRNGGVNNADAQPLKKLDQLLNFTNYNKPTKGGWLDKYQ